MNDADRVQVVIIGAGPAGLLLGALLHRAGVEALIVEQRSAEYVLGRIRAGVLEHGSTVLLQQAGAGERMAAVGLRHGGIAIGRGSMQQRIDLQALTGRSVTVYGQTEVTLDLMKVRDATGATTLYEATDVRVHDIDTLHPSVGFVHRGVHRRVRCDFIAGCDGFHGVSRASVPESAIDTWERTYPFGWLGILSETPPVSPELIYVNSDRGFALCSMRSATRSRYYLQCSLDDQADRWSDDAFWTELRRRLPPEAADALVTGTSIEKSIAPLRSFVASPLRFGSLFLAGDAAHIVPPTGAKGLNLALSDVGYLAQALGEFYVERSDSGLRHYSERCLERVWNAVRFSWWFTSLMHDFPENGGFGRKMQDAEIRYLMRSEAAQKSLAENYVGL